MPGYFSWSFLFQHPRRIKYKLLSNNKHVTGKPITNQPALLIGQGEISFGKNVHLGFYPSPFFYNGYVHLESRSANSRIVIGDNVLINNNFFAISDGEGIYIGDNTLIGTNCEIIDSDFHELAPDKRTGGVPATKKVTLGKNVFLGNNVKITKGVTLGDNVVVANGSVVGSSFPDNAIIGGVPAKIIGEV
jgi:acetyltransferase-like isoleucine patch superfamily enzyme